MNIFFRKYICFSFQQLTEMSNVVLYTDANDPTDILLYSNSKLKSLGMGVSSRLWLPWAGIVSITPVSGSKALFHWFDG